MSGLLLCLAFATPSISWADAPPSVQLDDQVAAVVRAVQDRYAGVDVLRATFVQVTRSSLYGDEEQRGSVVLQRPRKMRWAFEGSGTQFVTDGSTMWIYNPADKQVLRYRDFSAQASTADQLLQSLHKLGELFEVELLDATEGYKLALKPRDEAAKAQVKAVQLGLDADYSLKSLVITDAFEMVTELTFDNVKLGGTVDAATFQFEIPQGVEVIDSNAG